MAARHTSEYDCCVETEDNFACALERMIEEVERDTDFDLEPELLQLGEVGERLRIRLDFLRHAGLIGEPTTHTRKVIAPGTLDRYQVREELGAGGNASVHLAWDTVLQREVAIKVLKRCHQGAETRKSESRLLQEAQLGCRIDHPGIVPVHDVGRTPDGNLFLAMQRIRGVTLDTWLAQTAGPTVRERLEILTRVAETIASAHESGVLHRDLKPSNIMIGPFGETLVLDWGLGRSDPVAGDERQSGSTAPLDPRLTEPGDIVGTPAFLAPEVARGELSRIGPGTDVFGLGALLWFLLTREAPYPAPTPTEAMAKAREADRTWPNSPSGQAPVPRELKSVCDRAMHEDPERRYSSAQDFIDDLHAYLDDRPGQAWEDGLRSTFVKWVRRRPAIALSVAATAVIALLAAGAAREFQRKDANAARFDRKARVEGFLNWRASVERELAPGFPSSESTHPFLRGASLELGSRKYDEGGAAEACATALANLGIPLADSTAEAADAAARLVAELPHLKPHLLDGLLLFTVWSARARSHDTERRVAAGIVRELSQEPEFSTAVDAWQALGSRNPEPVLPSPQEMRSATAAEAIGTLLYLTERKPEALAFFERAAELKPGLFWAQFRAGTMLIDGVIAIDEFDARLRAIIHLQGAVSARPTSVWAWTNLGLAYAESGLSEQAALAYRKAIGHLPVDPSAVLAAQQTAEASSDPQAARVMGEYRAILQEQPVDPTPLMNLANLVRDMGGPADEVESLFQQALAISPGQPLLHYNYSLFLGETREDLVAEREHLLIALDGNPELGAAWMNLGFNHACSGEFEESLACFERAEELDYEQVLAAYNQAYAHICLDQPGAALVVATRMIRILDASAHHPASARKWCRGILEGPQFAGMRDHAAAKDPEAWAALRERLEAIAAE